MLPNGPIKPNIAHEIIDTDQAPHSQEEEKNLQGARSTDLIFLNSVVQTNTLERPKKVGKIRADNPYQINCFQH